MGNEDGILPTEFGRRQHDALSARAQFVSIAQATHAPQLERPGEFNRIVLDFLRGPGSGHYTLEPLLSRNPLDGVYRFALEFAFATYQTLSRDEYGRSFKFSCLRAVYAAPLHARVYRRNFQSDLVRAARQRTGFRYDLDRPPMVRPDKISRVMAGEMCEQLLDDANQDGGIAADIRRNLLEHLGHFPSMEAMAAELSMHPRALRRRLEAQQSLAGSGHRLPPPRCSIPFRSQIKQHALSVFRP